MSLVQFQGRLDQLKLETQQFSKLSKDRKKKVAQQLGTSPKAHEEHLAASVQKMEIELRNAAAGHRRPQLTADASDGECENRPKERSGEDESENELQGGDEEIDDMSVLTLLTRSSTHSPTPSSLGEDLNDEQTIGLRSAIDPMNIDTPSEDGPTMLSAAGTKVRQNLLPDVVRRFNQSFRLWSSQSNHVITTGMAEAATTLHESVLFVSRTLGISLSDAEWPIQHAEFQLCSVDVKHMHAWMQCQAFSAELPTFWDHDDQTDKVLTRAVANTALSQQGAHIGIIEVGRETALHVFLNQQNKRKCLSCSKGPRGKSAVKKALSQRGSGEGYLDCHCPEDDALLLLWLYKISAAYNVPKVETAPELRGGIHKLDLHPLNLPYVAAGIQETSGLLIDGLLRPKVNRLASTLSWSANKLAEELEDDWRADKLRTIIRALDALFDDLFE